MGTFLKYRQLAAIFECIERYRDTWPREARVSDVSFEVVPLTSPWVVADGYLSGKGDG